MSSLIKWQPPQPGLIDYIRVCGPSQGFSLWLSDTLRRLFP